MYLCLDTGEEWTLEEIKNHYEQFKHEMTRWDYDKDVEVPRYESFEDYLEEMLRLGREGVGGFQERDDSWYYIVDGWGTVHAEAGNRKEAIAKMNLMFTQEEIIKYEIEVI